jgi:hypothetical protein
MQHALSIALPQSKLVYFPTHLRAQKDAAAAASLTLGAEKPPLRRIN